MRETRCRRRPIDAFHRDDGAPRPQIFIDGRIALVQHRSNRQAIVSEDLGRLGPGFGDEPPSEGLAHLIIVRKVELIGHLAGIQPVSAQQLCKETAARSPPVKRTRAQPFLSLSTCLRRPSVAVSAPPLTLRLSRKPGIGTTGSTVISNRTLVLFPSGVSV